MEYEKIQELVLGNESDRNILYDSIISKLRQLGDIIQYKSLLVEEQLGEKVLGICREENSCDFH